MRILLVSAYFPPHVGGIEQFTHNLAGGFAARGHDVRVVCLRTDPGSAAEDVVDGYRVTRVEATNVVERRLGVPYPLPDPRRLFATLGGAVGWADVVHVQDALYASSLSALAIARRRRVPTILTQHVGFIPQRNRTLDAVERAALATLGRSSRLAQVVATVNPAVAEWASRVWGLSDVRNLPTGVVVATSDTSPKDEVRRSFGLPSETFTALFVGRNVHTKGLDVFLDAHDPSYRLVAVTDADIGPRANITVLPFMAHARLHRLYDAVDAFVLSSRDEGMPVALQEALAHGLPVVTTRLAGLDAYISDDDALYVDRGDSNGIRVALRRLATDPALRANLSERSRGVARAHFSLEACLTAYEELYVEVCAGR